MAISKIQYDDKVAINIDSTIPDINKCNASDLNEIKSVVNNNADEIPSNDNLVNVGSSVDTDYKVNVLTTKNLYNIATNTNGKVIGTDGSEVDSTGYCISDYIAVQPNTTYTISRVYENLPSSEDNMRLGLYTQNKTWIERANSSNKPYVYTTPSNCYFIRLSYQYTITNTNVQVELGNEATTYEAFIPNTINVNNEKYTDTINVGTSINDKNRVNVLYSHNLFDKNTISVGQWLNADGTLSSNSDFSTSDFIPIVAGEQYYLPKTNTRRLKYYNSSKTPLTTSDWDIASGSDNQVLTIPNNASYVKITIQTNVIDINTFMFNEGSTALPYEPYLTPSINVDGEEIYNASLMDYIKPQLIDISSYKTNNVNSITRAYMQKCGNIIKINVAVSNSSTTSGTALFENLPYKPSYNVELTSVNNNNQTTRCILDTNGKLTISTAQATAYYINGIYFID